MQSRCHTPEHKGADSIFAFVRRRLQSLKLFLRARRRCRSRFALIKQANLGKGAHFQENERNAKGGRGRRRRRARFCKFIKRVIFSWEPCTTIHHLTSKAPYPFKAADSELDIDTAVQINYLLGLRFIDKPFGQMISNNHK